MTLKFHSLFVLLCLGWFPGSSALAEEVAPERRVALVIGNAAYGGAPLKTSVTDARAMADALTRCHFEVAYLENADQGHMKQALRTFGEELTRASAAFFFYSGHAVQVRGRNFLVPVGTEIPNEDELTFRGADLRTIVDKLPHGSGKFDFVVLDASREFTFSSASKPAKRGLAAMEAPAGIHLLFSAAPGEVVAESSAPSSLYVRALLANLEAVAMKADTMFKRVRAAVQSDSGYDQNPFDKGTSKDFMFLATPPPPPEESASHIFERAEEARGAGKFIEACTLYQLAANHREPRALPALAALVTSGQGLPDSPVEAKAIRGEGEAIWWETIKGTSDGKFVLAFLRAFPGGAFWNAGVARLKELGIQTPFPPQLTKAGIDFILVQPGEFVMGSENEAPAHRVRITSPYYLGKYEVTQAQWQTVMNENPSHFEGPNLPVDKVSWEDAQNFIRILNSNAGGPFFRLPTEAEWEYACRAGTTTRYAFGDDISKEQANFSSGKTRPVGSYAPNAWGFYDMHGNVAEWCADFFDRDTYATSRSEDPQGPAQGSRRVMRGGSWFTNPRAGTSSAHMGINPSIHNEYNGFRLVLLPSIVDR